MGRADQYRPARSLRRIAALFKAGALDGDWAQLWDFTGVENVDGVSTAGVRRVADGNPWPRSAIRVCIVNTDEQFGLVRMYQALRGEPKTDEVGITRSAAEADAFIASEPSAWASAFERAPGARQISEPGTP